MDWSTFSDCRLTDDSGKEIPASIKCFEALYANLVIAIVGLAGIALFIMFLMGGFTYLTSAGDAKKAQKAQQIMLWAVVGAVIMVSSYLILSAIRALTGVDLLQFTIPT